MAIAFHAGSNLTAADVLALGPHGPYRLTVRHPHGVIVEYFATTDSALRRQLELEELLRSAQEPGARPSDEATS